MAPSEKISANTPWTDDELRASVEVYVTLLRLQLQGSKQRMETPAQAILGGVLGARNNAAIRYRMRNISAVVQEFGIPTLADFSPAESVGTIVRPRIRSLLLETSSFTRLLSPASTDADDARGAAIGALRILRREIEDLEAELAWRGHNGPPDRDDLIPTIVKPDSRGRFPRAR